MVNVLTCVSFPEGKEGAPLFGGVHCIHRLSTGSCSPSPHKNTAPRSAHRHLRYNPSHMPVGLALLDPRKRPCNPIIFSGICVDDCLSVKPGSVTGALQHLHSVICIPQPPRPLPPYLSTEVNPNSPEVVPVWPWRENWFRHRPGTCDFSFAGEKWGSWMAVHN